MTHERFIPPLPERAWLAASEIIIRCEAGGTTPTAEIIDAAVSNWTNGAEEHHDLFTFITGCVMELNEEYRD
jgi:hypothetical protein